MRCRIFDSGWCPLPGLIWHGIQTKGLRAELRGSVMSGAHTESPKWIRRSVIGVTSALMIGGGIGVAANAAPGVVHEETAGSACSAPTGQMCLAIDNQTKGIHSWRRPDNNQCLTNSEPGKTTHYESFLSGDPSEYTLLYAFSDGACGKPVNPGHGYGTRSFS